MHFPEQLKASIENMQLPEIMRLSADRAAGDFQMFWFLFTGVILELVN